MSESQLGAGSLGSLSLGGAGSGPSKPIMVDEFQAFLVAEAVGQLPDAMPSPLHPSIWTLPRQGAPLPRQDDGAWLEETTITLNDTNLQARPNLEAWIEEAYIDVTVRSVSPNVGKLVHRVIRGLLQPVGLVGGRKGWTMNNLPVLYSRVWRGEQPLPPQDGGVTYDRVASYCIACRRSDLA